MPKFLSGVKKISKMDNSFGETLHVVESGGRLYLRHRDFKERDRPIIKGRVPGMALTTGEEEWVHGVWKCWAERCSQ